MTSTPRLSLVALLSLGALAVPIVTTGCPTPPDEGEGEGEEGEGEEGEGEEGEGEEGEGEEGEGEPQEDGVYTIETCAGAPAGGGADVCAVTPGAGGTIVFGAILTPGTVFEGGAVVFDDDGAITCVGCNCAAGAAGFTQVACGDAAVSPGLINAHDHAGWMNDQPWYLTPANSGVRDTERWEHRHDWRRGRRNHNEIDAPGGANADAKALGEFRFALSGATATLASGGFANDGGGVIRNLDDGGDMGDLGVSSVRYVTFPLGDSNATQLATGCAYPEIANKPNGPNAPHVSEGIDNEANNEFQCLSSAANGGKDVLDDNAAIIHGVGLKPADVAIMAERGVSLIWSPRSNISLYGETAPVTLMKNLGVNIALGTDWLPSGSMNMQRELACVIGLNDNNYGGAFSREEMWRMVTVNAARATHVEGAIGTLAVGSRADIAIFARRGGAFASVVESSTEDVALVLKSGRPLTGNAAVVAALDSTCDTLDVCGVSKRLCATRETGKALAALTAGQNGFSYALASCADETPIEEPTCLPARSEAVDVINGSTLYPGTPSANDNDGDGIDNATDNCPDIFNPARPVDGGGQANADGDGDGDVCDPCPLDADTTTCAVFNPNDRDGDGVDADTDNCVDDANADQADDDEDGKGDVCDACPNAPNPGDEGCATSVVDIKTNPAITAAETRVKVENVVVTAVGSNGFWMQLDPATPGYPGVNHTCIFGFVGAAEKPAVGDKLTVNGTASLFFGQAQVKNLTFTVASQGNAVAPTVVAGATLADVSALGAASPLEGCLVEVTDAVVENAAPVAGAGDAGNPLNEFALQGDVRVDDFLFFIDPQPRQGERFAFIRGPLALKNSLLKLLPRNAADVGFGDVEVDAFVDEAIFARIGATQPAGLGQLTLRLTRAPAADTVVTLDSSETGIATVPASVTVLAGQNTATVAVTGVAAGQADITATLETSSASARVDVVADNAVAVPVAIDPVDATVVINRTAVFTVDLDVPAPVGGTTLTVTTTGAIGTAPSTVNVAANATSATVTLTAPAAAGTGTLRVAVGATGVTANVTIIELAPLGLVINEIDYDQAGGDSAEFLEIFNGTGAPVDVGGFDLVFVNGSGGAAYRTVSLTGTIPVNGYLVVAPQALLDPLGAAVVKVALNGSDLMQNGAPDGVILFDAADAVVDGLAYEGAMPGIALRDQVIDLIDARSTTLADIGGTDLCRDPPNGAWLLCNTLTAGAANVP